MRFSPTPWMCMHADYTCKDTPLEESITALDEIRKAGKTKYIGLSECSAATLRKANSSEPSLPDLGLPHIHTHAAADPDPVAKIDALQAEYSAFETLHETDGLIEAAKELGVAYVAYSPLGHGWLVDDFPYKTPDDFAPNDFRRSGKSIQGSCRSPGRAFADDLQFPSSKVRTSSRTRR